MINQLMKKVHETAVEHGWYEEERNFGELIALMHSELSEALEEARSGHNLTQTYYKCKSYRKYDCEWYCYDLEICSNPKECKHAKPCGIPSEFADCIIRILDACGYYGIDIEAALKEKIEFNQHRPYKHGKQF